MVLTKNQFFLLALAVLLSIFFTHKVVWLLTAKKAKGEVMMTGHGNLGSALGLSTYQVVKFRTGRDTIVFNGEIDVGLQSGAAVNVLYQVEDPRDARIDAFKAMWMDAIVYSAGPLLILIVIFLVPDIIPPKSKIMIGRKGLKIIDEQQGQ